MTLDDSFVTASGAAVFDPLAIRLANAGDKVRWFAGLFQVAYNRVLHSVIH
jgi:hypothetical protein